MEETPRAPQRPLGRIAAVVVNFDGESHLPHCLGALGLQTRPADEVIVVDNASRDQSLRLLAERHPAVRVIRMGANLGPCPARNRGLEEAGTEWVLLLDNDAVLAPDALERLERAAAARPDAALLQPRSVFAGDPARVHYDGGAFHYAGFFSLRNFGAELARAEGRGVVEVGGAVSVALLAHRRSVLDAGGFDPAFFILFEDLDLSYRLRLAGRAILSVEEALCVHRGGTEGISLRGAGDYPRRRVFLHSRNRWLFVLKDYRLRTLAAALPGLALVELAWALFALRSGTLGGWLAGKAALLRELPALLRRRRQVQRSRSRGDRELLVGGPLTVHPHLATSGGPAVRWLDRLLAAWWRLARPMAG